MGNLQKGKPDERFDQHREHRRHQCEHLCHTGRDAPRQEIMTLKKQPPISQ